MKRDMELVRQILIAQEDDNLEQWCDDMGHKYADREFEKILLHHVELLVEAGFLEAVLTKNHRGEVSGASIQKLTWEGHDFLDAARNEKVWKKAMNKIATSGGAVTFALTKELLKKYATEALGL